MESLFISYSRKDAVVARMLASALAQLDVDVFLDVERLVPGVDWLDSLAERIDGADIVAVLWSGSSVQSKMVMWEAARALSDHKLFPIILDRCSLPETFSHLHCYDLLSGILDRDASIRLVAAIIEFRKARIEQLSNLKGASDASQSWREDYLEGFVRPQEAEFKDRLHLGDRERRYRIAIHYLRKSDTLLLSTDRWSFWTWGGWSSVVSYQGACFIHERGLGAHLISANGDASIDLVVDAVPEDLPHHTPFVSFYDPCFRRIFWKVRMYPEPDPPDTAS